MTSSPSHQTPSYYDGVTESPKSELLLRPHQVTKSKLLWRPHRVSKTQVTVTSSPSHPNPSYCDALTKSPKSTLIWRKVSKIQVTMTSSPSHQNPSYYDLLTESPKAKLLWRLHEVTIASTSDCNKSDESSIYCRIIVSMESNVNMSPQRKIVKNSANDKTFSRPNTSWVIFIQSFLPNSRKAKTVWSSSQAE